MVLTKVDVLENQLELDLPTNETLEDYRSRHLDEHCIGPLCEVAGSDVTHVTVSGTSDWSRTIDERFLMSLSGKRLL